MELSITSRMVLHEAASVAQELGMMEDVTANQVFYGLLRLAGEKTSPAEGIVRDSILGLQEYFSSVGINLEETERALKDQLGNTDSISKDEVIGMADLVATTFNEKELHPNYIARVIMSNPSPTIREAIVKVETSIPDHHSEDAVMVTSVETFTTPSFTPQPVEEPVTYSPPTEEPAASSRPVEEPVSSPSPQPIVNLDPIPESNQGAVRTPPSSPPVTPVPDWFAEGAILEDSPNQSRNRSVLQSGGRIFIHVPNVPDVQNNQKQVREGKKESIGARIIKTVLYLVLTVGIPLLVCIASDTLSDVERVMQGVPTNDFSLLAFISIWGAVVANTLSVLIKKISPAGKVFVQFLIGIALINLLGMMAVSTGLLYEMPIWLKIVLLVANITIIGITLSRLNSSVLRYDVHYEGLKAEARMFTGVLQDLFFEHTVKSFIIPVAALFVLSFFMREITGGWLIACQIYVFLWAYSILDYLFQVIGMNAQRSPYSSRGKKKAAALAILLSRLLALPIFGVFLLTLFNWWPMPIWLIVIYGIYLLIALGISVIGYRMD